MLGWSHQKFRERLFMKAEEYPDCIVHEVTEPWTSKTCCSCGRINHELGGSKIFRCKHCKFEIDRDKNGATNIMIMNIEKVGYSIRPSSLDEGLDGYTL